MLASAVEKVHGHSDLEPRKSGSEPTRPSSSDCATSAAERGAQPGSEKILIVDDVRLIRDLFTECLKEKYECHQATSVMEAFERLKETDYAVVVTDVLMPGLSGIELLRKVVEKYPDTAVIVVTGVDRPHRVADAMRLGAFDYLIKPCEPDVLSLVVERAVARRELTINARKYKQDLEISNRHLLEANNQLRRLQAQIVHNEKMASLGQLTAGVAHELNNPLGFIYSNLDILKNDIARLRAALVEAKADDGQAERPREIDGRERIHQILEGLTELIDDCQEGAERVKDVVQNLRLFSRLDEAALKRISIHDGIDSSIRLLSRYFSQGNIVLRRDYGPVPEIEAFAGQLNQLWMNLLANAAQAVSKNGGEVTVSTCHKNDQVFVTITDTGVGISPEHLDRIFDPFFTTKPVGEGTGLGLSISFGIVERHGGRIRVESKVSKGTTFTVTLPIEQKPQL